MRRVFRGALRVVQAIGVVLLVAASVGLWWLDASLPELSGSHTVAGIAEPARIVRDRNGVPHIYARSYEDAMYALGFVHAQDRLFQMESQRRIGAGRMSEVAGSSALGLDRMMRALGLYRRAEADFAHLERATQRALEAYAAGVNAYLRHRREKLPPEFLIIGEPEPWKPADTLVWGKLMALNLSTGWREKLLRAVFVQRLGADKAAAFFPTYPGNGPVTMQRDRAALPAGAAPPDTLPSDLPLLALWRSVPELLTRRGLSNQWVLGGAHTDSGKPILANDPHLSLDAPSLWYLVRIETPQLKLSGASVPGVGGIIIGHNGHIAWGVTTSYIDTEDLVVERLDPEQAGRYMTPEGGKPFTTRTEKIAVRFGADVTMTVRETRHGPVLDDAIAARYRPTLQPGNVLALRAPWLEPHDTTADALRALHHARDWNEFGLALAKFVAPVQNFLYADTAGNIGYYVPGHIPARKEDNGGILLSGWSESRAGVRYIPFAELPHAFNPQKGFIVNANNRIAGPEYPYFLSREWGDHYRALRIEELIGAGAKQSADTTAAIQGDHVSLMARDLLRYMMALPAEQMPKAASAAPALALLRNWDGTMDRNRAEPLIFSAWLAALNRRLYADELGDWGADFVSLRPDVVKHILTKHTEWCDDVTTQEVETCPQILALSLGDALAWIEARYGGQVSRWRWGAAHRAEMRHRLFSFLPIINGFGTLSIETDGDGRTVNKTDMYVRDTRAPYAARHGAGYRGIYTLADLDASRFILSTGPSGHPLSRFYDSMLKDWRDIRYVTLARDRAEAERGAAGVIDLKPLR
ncbi:MAG TPA: penicillin acylase family protein [Alphaproteobacteria bacterium]|jgi:penicillin amidase